MVVGGISGFVVGGGVDDGTRNGMKGATLRNRDKGQQQ